MNALLKYLAILLPILTLSQTTPIPESDIKIAIEVIQGKKTIDRMKTVKAAEVQKQLHLISLIQKRIAKLQSQKKIKSSNDLQLLSAKDTLQAIKQDTEIVYWEEIPRKFFGRLLHKEDTKIRIFRFENGEKIYID